MSKRQENLAVPGGTDSTAEPNSFEAFPEGRVLRHHWGRTVSEADGVLFATQTHQYEPRLHNTTYAEHVGAPVGQVSALLVFAIVLGLSVEDLSESGGTFLGADNIRFHMPVVAGDTLTCASIVIERRLSRTRPGWGIVTWQTAGVNQQGDTVITYSRTSLVRASGTGKAPT